VGGATDLEGVVLRYGGFYGPGTGIAAGEDGEILQMIRKRRMPIVGDGGGVWCFVHAVDAADATVAAVERGAPGLYNIVDDEPARMSAWLPALAEAIGAKPPRHVPVWLARLLVGEHGVNLMTKTRGSSNAKAKRELGWTLKYPTWREGFVKGL
jgi:nucleoside-diphosphate-sugar epimerase